MDLQTTINGVVPKLSRDGQSTRWVFYLADLAGQEPATFDPALKAKGELLVGQPGVTVRLSQNGKYWNIEDVVGPGQALPPMAVPAGTPVMGAPVANGAQQGVFAPGFNPDAQRQATNERIAKQEAQKTAVALVAAFAGQAGLDTFESAKAAVDDYARHLYNQAAGTDVQPAPVPQTPAEVVQQVNDMAGQLVVQQGLPTASW